jgi:hypothetical protein
MTNRVLIVYFGPFILASLKITKLSNVSKYTVRLSVFITMGRLTYKKLKYTLQSHSALLKYVFIKLAFANRCESLLFYEACQESNDTSRVGR